jgi:uncharacterized protein (UPF0335 family)
MSTHHVTGAAQPPAASTSDASAPSEQQISLSLPNPAEITPASIATAPVSEAPKEASTQPLKPVEKLAAERPRMIEMPKVVEMPKPVEAAMKTAAAMKSAESSKASSAPFDEPLATTLEPPARAGVADESRSNRFAMLAASVAFAGALGAMAGALGTAVFAPPLASADASVSAADLTSLRDSITGLRSEIGAIKSSVEASNRTANAQLAKFTERLERVDRAQAAPAAQLKLAMEAIERLEKRAQASGDTTGSVRAQPAAANASAEPPRQRVIEGWTVRHVSRGVAIIQGRAGAIEIEAGDIVPGVGRIESMRRQDGRWVVLTSNGMIKSPTPR